MMRCGSRKVSEEMKATENPRVKICCIQSIDEAWMAIEHGASAVGLVSAMPREAIREVRPFGVDVCSGLRIDGLLDPQKLAAFFRATDEHG
jgi:phosphoribosylanthranilate isomerase